jgi:type II pantothenate kinase
VVAQNTSFFLLKFHNLVKFIPQMIIGIDIGGTTTDIVGLLDGDLLNPLTVKADDPVTSAAGALGKFLEVNNFALENVRLIAATGVGAGKIQERLFGIPVINVDEFDAIGTAGLFLSGLQEAVVVSMGTGTAVVVVKDGQAKHWGGSGVGGGTLVGLARRMLNITTIHTLIDKAGKGRLENVDLTVGDIAGGSLDKLPASITASNFGKMADEATDEDIAYAIFNLVAQTIGVMSIAAARSEQLNNIILTGKLSGISLMKNILEKVADLYATKFLIPKHADFATAIGAALFVSRSE